MISKTQSDRLRAQGFTLIPAQAQLPPPHDAWRFIHGSKHDGRIYVPRDSPQLLAANLSMTIAQLSPSNIGHIHLAKQGFSDWATVERPTDDALLRQIQDHDETFCILNFPPSRTLLAIVTHEHCTEISWLESSNITPYTPDTPLDETFFHQSNVRPLSLQLTYTPLTMTRTIRRGHRHTDMGNFEFDIIKQILARGLYTEIASKCSPHPQIDLFATSPASATYHLLDTLVENQDHIAFLFFAAHALSEQFHVLIDFRWLWRFPASKQALLQLRQMNH